MEIAGTQGEPYKVIGESIQEEGDTEMGACDRCGGDMIEIPSGYYRCLNCVGLSDPKKLDQQEMEVVRLSTPLRDLPGVKMFPNWDPEYWTKGEPVKVSREGKEPFYGLVKSIEHSTIFFTIQQGVASVSFREYQEGIVGVKKLLE